MSVIRLKPKRKDRKKILRDKKVLINEKKRDERIRAKADAPINPEEIYKKAMESTGKAKEQYLKIYNKVKDRSYIPDEKIGFIESSGKINIYGTKLYHTFRKKGLDSDQRHIRADLVGYEENGLIKVKYKKKYWYCSEGGNFFKYTDKGIYTFLYKCHIEMEE
jgi:hypothetical protein